MKTIIFEIPLFFGPPCRYFISTGCPTIEYSLCFGCFLGFQCSYRCLFYHFSTAQEMTIPKLTLLSSLRLTLIKLQSKTWGKLDLDIIFWYIQSLSKLYLNPICLTFCSVTWSIFDVGRKVRWVLESSSPGLLKNGKILLCKSSGSWENNQNKVNTQLWDTLYVCNQGPGTEMQTHLLMMVCRLQLWWYQSGTIYWIHSPLCRVCPRWSSAQQLVVFTIIYR